MDPHVQEGGTELTRSSRDSGLGSTDVLFSIERGATASSSTAAEDHTPSAPLVGRSSIAQETQYNVPQCSDVDIHARERQEFRDIDIREERFHRKCAVCLQKQAKFISYPCGCLLACLECRDHTVHCCKCDRPIICFDHHEFNTTV